MFSKKREHSKKPDEKYKLIESCSYGPFLELFARGTRLNWSCWGNEANEYYPEWNTYKNHSQKDTSRIIKLPETHYNEKYEQLKLLEKSNDYNNSIK